MARCNLMKNIVSSRRQPHSPLDNVNTPYNPIRLLKGAPPGQEAVNHYISELSIEKSNNSKLADKQRKHLVMLEACDDEYNYHYKMFGQGAGADRDMKFYAPQLVQDYVNQIRRFWSSKIVDKPKCSPKCDVQVEWLTATVLAKLKIDIIYKNCCSDCSKFVFLVLFTWFCLSHVCLFFLVSYTI